MFSGTFRPNTCLILSTSSNQVPLNVTSCSLIHFCLMTSSPDDVINEQKPIFGRFTRMVSVKQAKYAFLAKPKDL